MMKDVIIHEIAQVRQGDLSKGDIFRSDAAARAEARTGLRKNANTNLGGRSDRQPLLNQPLKSFIKLLIA